MKEQRMSKEKIRKCEEESMKGVISDLDKKLQMSKQRKL